MKLNELRKHFALGTAEARAQASEPEEQPPVLLSTPPPEGWQARAWRGAPVPEATDELPGFYYSGSRLVPCSSKYHAIRVVDSSTSARGAPKLWEPDATPKSIDVDFIELVGHLIVDDTEQMDGRGRWHGDYVAVIYLPSGVELSSKHLDDVAEILDRLNSCPDCGCAPKDKCSCVHSSRYGSPGWVPPMHPMCRSSIVIKSEDGDG